MPASASAGKLSDPKFAAPAKPADKILGQAEYPLSSGGMGVSTYALSQIPEGTVKGVFFYQSNCVAGYSNPAQLTEFLASAELSVAIDVQLTETCQACQYVLPDTCYLERLEVPEFVGGKVPVVSLRDRVIEKVHPNTKPVDEIFAELAEACGVGEYFQFTVDELADAQLQTVGLSLDALREEGTHVFEDKALKYALKTSWGTADKKVHFTSEACEKARFRRRRAGSSRRSRRAKASSASSAASRPSTRTPRRPTSPPSWRSRRSTASSASG